MKKFKTRYMGRGEMSDVLQEESEKGWELVAVLPDPYVSYAGHTQYTVVLSHVQEDHEGI